MVSLTKPWIILNFSLSYLDIFYSASRLLSFPVYFVKSPLKLSHKAEYHLRKDIFAHLTRLDSSYYRTQRTGDLMTRLSSDINMVRDAIGQGLLQGIRTIVVLVFALIVMLLTDRQLAFIVYALYIPMVIIFFLILRVMRRRQKELQEQVSELSSFSQESFSGIRCLKGFALEERRNQQFERLNQGLIQKYAYAGNPTKSLAVYGFLVWRRNDSNFKRRRSSHHCRRTHPRNSHPIHSIFTLYAVASTGSLLDFQPLSTRCRQLESSPIHARCQTSPHRT